MKKNEVSNIENHKSRQVTGGHSRQKGFRKNTGYYGHIRWGKQVGKGPTEVKRKDIMVEKRGDGMSCSKEKRGRRNLICQSHPVNERRGSGIIGLGATRRGAG